MITQTKAQLLREEKTSKFKEQINKPLFEEQFKMSKFTEKSVSRTNTHLKPFATATGENLGNETKQ